MIFDATEADAECALAYAYAAALFLTQLGQALKVLGLETSWQMMFQGVAIALGMFLSEVQTRKRRGG